MSEQPSERASRHRNAGTDDTAEAGTASGAWAELLRAARIALAEQDLDLHYTAVLDPAAISPLGPDAIGRHESQVVASGVVDELSALKQRAIGAGTSQQARFCLAGNAEPRWFETTVTPRRDEAGRTTGVLSLSVDLTDIVREKERLRTSEARLAGILRSAMDAIVSIGPDHRIVYFNPAAEKMFGVREEEAIGSDVARFLPADVRDGHPTAVSHFGATGETVRRPGALGTLHAVRASGETFPIEASISHTGSGADQLYTVIIRDRSEHDQLQVQLLQSQKLEGIGRLAGGVAHDFNNLLTVILGYCELLRIRQRTGVELDEIGNAARRASQLTRQLLAFSRRQVLQVETLDLNALIRGLNRMLRRIIGEDIVLRTELAEEPMWIVADVGQMEQVLLNLVVNARDAMPTGGTLRVATRLVDRPPSSTDARPTMSVELTVMDTGVGMSDDVRSRIFEPFFTTKGETGTGLGLATVYGVVMQTGGEIACTSAPGEGATFRVWLPPALPPAEQGEDASTPARVAHGRETVLLVEDDGLVREFAARALREYGYKVLEAHDVEGALRYVESPAVAIVVSDVVMPGRTVDELTGEIARLRPGLPVLLMTGYLEAPLQRTVDPEHLLRKPFTPTDLISKIRHLIDARQR